MAVVGVLEIQMAADLARLSNDMKRAQTTVGSTVQNINRVLGAIGVGVSFAVIGKMIKDVSSLNQRYQELGISLTVVGRNVGIQRAELDKTAASLQKMGISMIESRQTVLKLASSHIDLAKAEKLADLARNAAIIGQTNTSAALGRIVHGIRSAELEVLKTIGITVSFEQSYKDLAAQLGKTTKDLTQLEKQQARVNVVLAEAPALAGLYEAAMGNAGKQFRSTDRLVEDLKVRMGGLFDLATRSAVTAYTDILKDLDGQIDEVTGSGEFKQWGDDIARAMATAADTIGTFVSGFKIAGLTLGAFGAQVEALTRLDFDAIKNISVLLQKDIDTEVAGFRKVSDALESEIIQRDLLSSSVTGVSNAIKQKIVEEKKEIALGKEKQKISAAQALANLKVAESTRRTIQLNRDVERITESVATEQEKYNETLRELEGLKPYLSVETYTRALQAAQDELTKTDDVAKETFDNIDQYAIGAARNIQSAFADFIFDPFDKGLKGMFKSFINTLRRIAAEAVSSRILGSISGGSLFSASSSSSGGGLGSLLSGASLARGGLGFGGLIGGAGTAFAAGSGGAGTAFIGGAGTAIGGSGVGAGGLAGGLTMPGLAAGALGVGIGSSIAGDKKIFGVSGSITSAVGAGIGMALGGPVGAAVGGVLGGGINALFGRGPFKFRRQELEGTASASGFEGGSLQDVFKSKGGLFASNRTRRRSAGNESDILDLFDEATRGFFASTEALAGNLELNADALNDLSIKVDLESEKKKTFTQEEFSAEIARIGDAIAESVLPGLSELAKRGESSAAALSRINSEFNTLVGLGNALNNTTGAARSFLLDLGAGSRTGLIDQLGGENVVAQFAEFFANSFLTESERLKISTDNLATSLRDAGFAADLSRDQYAALVKSFGTEGGITSSQLANLIQAGPALASIRDAADQMKLSAANDAFGALSRSVSAEQQKISKNIGIVTGRIGELNSVLQLTGNAINTIFPISKSQARRVIGQAANDIDFADPQIGNAIAALTKSSTSGFATRLDFLRDQSKSATALKGLEDASGLQLTIEEKTLEALKDDGERLEGILSNAQSQLDTLNGIKDILSVSAALAGFNKAISSGGGNGAADSLRALAATGASDLALYRAAKVSGIQGGFDAAVSALGFTSAEGAQFLRDTGLKKFASGGLHSGGLRLVGENGPELEFTGPSRIVSNSDTKKMIDNSEVVDILKKVLLAVEKGSVKSEDLYKLMKKMTSDGQSLNTRAA